MYISTKSTAGHTRVIVAFELYYLVELGVKVVRHHHKSRAVYPRLARINKATHKLIKRQQSSFPCTYHIPTNVLSQTQDHLRGPSRAKSCSLSHYLETQPSCNSRIINMREVISVNGTFTPRRAASPLFRLEHKLVNEFPLTPFSI